MRLMLRSFGFLLWLASVAYPMRSEAFVWIEKEIADAAPVDGDAHEGAAVALSGDILVVGAPNLDKPAGDFGVPPAVANAGGVRIYHRYGGGWTLDQTLFAPDPTTGAAFGTSVAIDGDLIVVGEARYTPPDISAAVHNGRALVYVRSPTTSKFVHRKTIFRLGFDLDGNKPEYGTSVDAAANRDREYAVAIGAPGEDRANPLGTMISDAGAVLVVRLHTSSDGMIEEDDPLDNSWYIPNEGIGGSGAGIHASAPLSSALFGKSVALTAGTCSTSNCANYYWLGIGAPNALVSVDDGDTYTEMESHGAAHLFRINSSSNPAAGDIFRQQQYLVYGDEHEPLYLDFFTASLGTTNQEYQYLGSSVDVRSIDNDIEMIVGASRALSSNGSARSGAAYYFRRFFSDCCLRGVQSLYPADLTVAEGKFGAHVAFASNRLLVGAPDSGSGILDVFEQADENTWNRTDTLAKDAPLRGGIAGSEDWIAIGSAVNRGDTSTWQRGWRLHITQSQDGAVMISPPLPPASPGVFCPPDCELQFENGRHLQPVAIPDDGYVFHHWTAPGTICDGSDDAACPLVMDGEHTITAAFAFNVLNTRTIGLGINSGNGSISLHSSTGTDITCPDVCGGIFEPGTFVSLIAQPADGFEFDGWTGPCVGNAGNTCSFQLTTNVQVAASFRAVDGNHVVNVEFVGTGPAWVGINSPSAFWSCDPERPNCSISAAADSTVSLGACTTSGGRFLHWGGDCSGSGICLLQLDSDKEVTATFEAIDSLFTAGFDDEKTCALGWFDTDQ